MNDILKYLKENLEIILVILLIIGLIISFFVAKSYFGNSFILYLFYAFLGAIFWVILRIYFSNNST